MKKILLSLSLVLVASAAFAGVYQQTVPLAAGVATNVSPNSYAVVGVNEIDLYGITPLHFTGTVTLIHTGITTTPAVITGTVGSATFLFPSSTTNSATITEPVWFFTNAPVAAGSAVLTAPISNIVQNISFGAMIPVGSVATVTVAQVGVTNQAIVTCVNGFGSTSGLTLPAASAATITISSGTNAGTCYVALKPIAPIVTTTGVSSGYPQTFFGPSDQLIWSAFGTNAVGANAVIKGVISQ